VALALVLLGRAAGAQPSPSAPGVAAKAEVEAEARAHFQRGNKFFGDKAWLEALSEYQQSLALMKNRATMANIAKCRRQLGQYDEALDAYEALRREFPKLSAKMEAEVAPAMAELEGLVGTLVVTGDAPAGASLFIDDRSRGRLPLAAPLRLRKGQHGVRVEKEGFAPIVATFKLEPGKENVIPLEAKSREGRLRVSEKHNWVLEVEVDGQVVGKTPWEGLVGIGDHRVRLRGFMSVQALLTCEVVAVEPGEKPTAAGDGARMESPAEAVSVALYETKQVMLRAEEMDGALRIESTPSGASVRVDGGEVEGATPWQGRLPLGQHRLELRAEGFVPVTQSMQLKRREQNVLSVTLPRAPDIAGARRAKNVAVGVAYGIGALGLGVLAVAGGLAVARSNVVKSKCPGIVCDPALRGDLDAVHALGRVAVAGLVAGGAGVLAGTVIVFEVRPGGGVQGSGEVGDVALQAGFGRFELRGSF